MTFQSGKQVFVQTQGSWVAYDHVMHMAQQARDIAPFKGVSTVEGRSEKLLST